MNFKTRRGAHRWRCKSALRCSTKPRSSVNIPDKSELLLISPSAYASPPNGTYEAGPILEKCFVTRRNKKPCSWKREGKMEKYLSLQERRLLAKFGMISKPKINIGPGSHDIKQWPENILSKIGDNVKKDLGFGKTPRFFTTEKFSTPGPGYVGKDHNPYFYVENKRKQGFSTVPTFEYDGLAPRIQRGNIFSLPPNSYQVQHPDSLDNFLRKRISKRGPYDLFTGLRDYSTIRGYFSSPITFVHPDWPQSFPGEIEKLFHKSNHFKGIFGKASRFPKNSDKEIFYPGPGYYDPEVPKKEKNFTKYPFGLSFEKETKLGSRKIRPCPGQYDPKIEKNIKGSGWTWVFKSKLPRIKSLAKEPYNDF